MLTHPSARSLRVHTPLSTESTCSHAHQHGVYVFTHPSARSLRVHTTLSTAYTCSHTPQHGVYVFTHPLARSLRVDLPLSTESTCILGYIYIIIHSPSKCFYNIILPLSVYGYRRWHSTCNIILVESKHSNFRDNGKNMVFKTRLGGQ